MGYRLLVYGLAVMHPATDNRLSYLLDAVVMEMPAGSCARTAYEPAVASGWPQTVC